MRVAVISDIHANLAAFRAVLSAIASDADDDATCDEVICLGDLVGYGPDPDACVALARERCAAIIGGNHDLAAVGRLPADSFNDQAQRALGYTRRVINAETISYLSGLPPIAFYRGWLLSHGSPVDPAWEYIITPKDALEAFNYQAFSYGFFGHSHCAQAFILDEAMSLVGRSIKRPTLIKGSAGRRVELGDGRYLFNPGSVGFPRDREDAHRESGLNRSVARYAIFDLDSGFWEFRRCLYEFAPTARRMAELGLW